MQYDDSRLQYDQSNVIYDGSWALQINETASFSESITKYIHITLSEVTTITEALTPSRVIKLVINEVSTLSETLSRRIGVVINEIVTMAESFLSRISVTISEAITISEAKALKYSITISDFATIIESLGFDIFGRLRGVISMVKEFVRIGDKKEKVSAINVGEGVIEQFNTPYRQYDDSSILYDQSEICYNNYISSEKPVFILGKKSEQVSLSNKKDKPIISKK